MEDKEKVEKIISIINSRIRIRLKPRKKDLKEIKMLYMFALAIEEEDLIKKLKDLWIKTEENACPECHKLR